MVKNETSSQENHIFTSGKHYVDLWKQTDQIFHEKQLPAVIAHSLTKYLTYCYNAAMKNNETTIAELLLADYQKVIDAMDTMEDHYQLLRINSRIENRVENIEKVYADSNDEKLYLEGQRKMFQALFTYFAERYVKDMQISGVKHDIVEVLAEAA